MYNGTPSRVILAYQTTNVQQSEYKFIALELNNITIYTNTKPNAVSSPGYTWIFGNTSSDVFRYLQAYNPCPDRG
jgi:hypothetical protein